MLMCTLQFAFRFGTAHTYLLYQYYTHRLMCPPGSNLLRTVARIFAKPILWYYSGAMLSSVAFDQMFAYGIIMTLDFPITGAVAFGLAIGCRLKHLTSQPNQLTALPVRPATVASKIELERDHRSPAEQNKNSFDDVKCEKTLIQNSFE